MTFFRRRVYADAAAATPLSRAAERELERLFSLYGNPGALHKEAVEAKQEVEAAREKIAETLGAHADEIIFTGSGTEANNLAIIGTLRPLLRAHGEVHAITSAVEHPSVLEALRSLTKEGLILTELPVDTRGAVSITVLKEAITEKTALVSVQMVNSEIGTIQDIHEIAKTVRHKRQERGGTLPLYMHTDASQAPLWLPVRVEKLGVDFLTLDAQKIMGPKGIGLLFARRTAAFEPIIFGGGQEKGKRSGTENTPFIGAFAVALQEAQKNTTVIAEKIAVLREELFELIEGVARGVMLNGPEGAARVANNLNISILGLDAEMAVIALDANGVAASTRSACDTDDEAPSHVLSAIGLSIERAKCSIRLTLLPTATKQDIVFIAKALQKVVLGYRQ